MKNKLAYRSPFTNPRSSFLLLSIAVGAVLGLLLPQILAAAEESQTTQNSAVQVGKSYHNDTSLPLRDVPSIWPPRTTDGREDERAREARKNPKLPLPFH